MGEGVPTGTHLPGSGTKVHFASRPCFLLFSLLSFGDPWIPSWIERPNVHSFCQVPCPALPCKPCLLLCYSRRNPVPALSQPCMYLSECWTFSRGGGRTIVEVLASCCPCSLTMQDCIISLPGCLSHSRSTVNAIKKNKASTRTSQVAARISLSCDWIWEATLTGTFSRSTDFPTVALQRGLLIRGLVYGLESYALKYCNTVF